jgi:hypothetical protein
MDAGFGDELAARSRFRRPPGRVAPAGNGGVTQAAARELADYAAGRLGRLPERPSRELLYSELLLLQRAYVRLLRRCEPPQQRPLQAAHEAAYARLEDRLDQIDPPLTTRPRRPPAARGEAPRAFGIEPAAGEEDAP